MSPLHSRGSPNKGRQNQWLPHSYLRGGPKEGGNATSPLHSRGSPNKEAQNQKGLPHACLLKGLEEGKNGTSPLHSRGPPIKGGKNQWPPHPCLCGGANKGRKCYVTPTFPGVPKQRGDKISGRLTLAFSGAQKRAEMLRQPCILGDPQTKRDKIRSGCLTRAFSKAHKRVKMLRPPCILGDPQTKG